MSEPSVERAGEPVMTGTTTGATMGAATGVSVEEAPHEAGFLARLGEAAQDNPASAALIAVGAAWLLAGGAGVSIRGGARRWTGAERAPYPHPGPYGGPSASYYGVETETPPGPGAEGTGRGAEAAGAAAHRAGAAAGRGAEVAGRTAARAAEIASSVGHGLGEAARTGRRGAGEAARSTGAAVSRASQAAWVETQDLSQSAREYLEDRPLAVGLLGLAAGVGLALALPRTRTEEEWLGATSESVRSEARRRVATGLEEARRSADDIAKRVIRDAQAHGLSPEAIAEVVGELRAKLERAALAGRDAARAGFGQAEADPDRS